MVDGSNLEMSNGGLSISNSLRSGLLKRSRIVVLQKNEVVEACIMSLWLNEIARHCVNSTACHHENGD